MSTRWSGAALALAMASSGCAEIRLRTRPDVVSETVLAERRETVVEADLRGDVEQLGSTVSLVVSRACGSHAVHDVRRVVRYAHYDANASATRALGISGASLLVGGVVIGTLPAMNVKTNAAADIGVGVPIAVLGTALAAAALVGVKQAHEAKEGLEIATIDDGAVEHGVPCAGLNKPVAGVVVEGRVIGVPGGTFTMGSTDARGRLDIDLGNLSGVVIRAAPAPKQLVLYGADTLLGRASLEGVEREVEERAWSELNLDGCATSTMGLGCAAAEKFLHDFPASEHAFAVRAAVERGHDGMKRRTQDEALRRAAEDRKEARERARAVRQAELIDRASSAARRASLAACHGACAAGCRGDQACASACTTRCF